MSGMDFLKKYKEELNEISIKYKNIVKKFEYSVIDIESMNVTMAEKIKMEALEVRCKDSQYLLEEVIYNFRLTENEGVNKYTLQVEKLLTDIRLMLSKNDLMGMIKHLEKIPSVLIRIDQDLAMKIEEISKKTLH